MSLSLKCALSQVLPGSTEPLGIEVLKSRGIFTDKYWYWIGVAAMVGYIFLFNGLFPVALAYLNREYHLPWHAALIKSSFKHFLSLMTCLDVPTQKSIEYFGRTNGCRCLAQVNRPFNASDSMDMQSTGGRFLPNCQTSMYDVARKQNGSCIVL